MPGAAGEASGFAGGDGLAGVEVGRLERPVEPVVVDGDHHGGGGLGVQVVGGQVLEELGEREPAPVPPVEARRRRARDASAGCGHRVEDLAQDRSGEARDGEVSGGGAVAVVVQAQRALARAVSSSVATSWFSWASTVRLVGLDGLDRPPARGGAGRGRSVWACSTSEASTSPALGLAAAGSCSVAREDHRRVRG